MPRSKARREFVPAEYVAPVDITAAISEDGCSTLFEEMAEIRGLPPRGKQAKAMGLRVQHALEMYKIEAKILDDYPRESSRRIEIEDALQACHEARDKIQLMSQPARRDILYAHFYYRRAHNLASSGKDIDVTLATRCCLIALLRT